MSILAVDTACGACSVALSDMHGNLLAEATETEASRQAERLVPMMDSLLKEQNTSYTDIKLLVTTIGPGSFTGLRIGMTAIKGVALVTGTPAMGVNTLETMASAHQRTADSGQLLVLLNALRGQVYAQKFLQGVVAACEPALIDIAEIPAWAKDCSAIAGNCTVIVQEILPNAPLLPDTMPHARDAARLAALRLASAATFTAPEPLYIRKPDAKLPGGRDA